jgi:hypothetical protein
MFINRITWVALLLLVACDSYADLARDAGKARSLEEPTIVLEAGLQHERDAEEHSNELELAFQYVPEIMPRLSLLAESVVAVWLNENGRKVSGIGDTELSVSYLLSTAGEIRPAVVGAIKVKLPTASEDDFGSGEVDYSAILVIGNEFEDLELNLELEITAAGEPEALPGGSAGNGPYEEYTDLYTVTLAADYGLTENLSCFAEYTHEAEVQDINNSNDLMEIGIEADLDISEDINVFLEIGVDSEGMFAPKVGVEIGW